MIISLLFSSLTPPPFSLSLSFRPLYLRHAVSSCMSTPCSDSSVEYCFSLLFRLADSRQHEKAQSRPSMSMTMIVMVRAARVKSIRFKSDQVDEIQGPSLFRMVKNIRRVAFECAARGRYQKTQEHDRKGIAAARTPHTQTPKPERTRLLKFSALKPLYRGQSM